MNKLYFLNKVIQNIFHNFIPNKRNVSDDKDPCWMDDRTKTIKKTSWFHHRKRRSSNRDYNMLNIITTNISNAVNSSKFKYHDRPAKTLNDSKTAAKTYWSIFRTLVNSSKTLLILLLSVGNRLVTDFLAKAKL